MTVESLHGSAAVDLHRLAYAVSCAETSCGTRGSAVSKRNAVGIMRFSVKDGKRTRYLAEYDNIEQSLAEFRSIWKRLYGGRCPTLEDAKRWTGNDRAKIWLGHVHSVYPCHEA